ncbi:MAG: dihydroneopterin aldolase [Oscillospiraceae bacterium]|jgi:dihydroneopterin aldolase|nr:dihydroneopterin aldolase [Oscillospiraceae bacterium]
MDNLDKIIVKGLRVFAHHGVNKQEKVDGQDFVIDITLWVNTKKAIKTDNLDKAVSYSQVAKFSQKIVTEKKSNLMETVADILCKKILDKFSDVKKVKVLIKKPNAPTDLDFEYMGVELIRER